ncbi:TonB-dependent siderophore receptor [Tardiphaga sp. 1201_B9_N1_1]|uniref:TonB-dependent siderophore receptor n=1 Tax=unclassified Tardiphaga TaxID=2631404 RepID=UPI0008A73BF5|nr:iron complex outermembrane recepter protein [Tardiphaga sp. OK245]
MTTDNHCNLNSNARSIFKLRRAYWLIGATFLLGDYVTGASIANAQTNTTLPPVTVESPTQARRPARAASATPSRARAVAARRNATPPPAPPTPTERAIAAAAAKYEQILGYRAMPNATTLRGATSPLNTSQVVNVVPQQVISDQRPRNLDDALVNISGITQTNTLAGTQDAVIRRGFGDNRDGSIMRNGMPIVQGRSFNPAVESIEVLKGPASLLYGIMDPGGIVNTISKRPELYQHGEVTLEGATYGSRSGANATIDITGPLGKDGLAYRFVGYGINEDYWRNFGTRKETLYAPSLAWYGDTTTVQINYEHRDFYSPFDRGTAFNSVTKAPFAIPATRRIDEPYNSMWGTSDLIQASVDQKINEDWKVYAGYSYNVETYNAAQLRNTVVNPTTGIATRSNDGTYGALTSSSFGTAYIQGGFWIGGMRNEVLFGGDAQYRVIYRKDLVRQGAANFNIFNPVYDRQLPGTTVVATDSDQTDKLSTQSLFFQDTLHLTNRVAVVGGVRYMTFDQLAGRGRNPFIANTDLSGNKALPLGGVILKVTDEVSLYASYTESLKPNSTIAPNGAVFDSQTKPEEGVSWETGIKFDINKRLSGTVALYDIDKKNVMLSQYNTVTTTNEARTAAAARSRGVEVDVTGKLTDSWSMIASYAYTDAILTQDSQYTGNHLQNVALNTGSLYLVYDFGTMLPGRLRVGAGAHYVGDRPGDAANSFVLPSYTVADAFATYETKYQTLPVIYQFNIKNIFDKVYYPSAVSLPNVALGDARRFSLAATVKF